MAGGLLALVVACVLPVIRTVQDRRDWRRQLVGLAVLAVLIGAGFLLVKDMAAKNDAGARSLWEFTVTLLEIAGWPVKIATFAPLFQAPLVILLVWALRTRRAASDPAWLLITLGLWGASQSAAVAYARAVGAGVSRYTDNLSVTLVVGFACLLYLCISVTGRFRRPLLIFGLVWGVVTVGGITEAASMRLPARIQRKHTESLVQENNVRAYLASGDIGALQNKARLDIPYSKAPELARLLSDPTLRSILPTNLRDELQPLQIIPGPVAGFRSDGLARETTKPAYLTTWGSFDPDTGPAPVGVIELHFPAGGRTSWLTLSVTGATQAPGISLTLLDEKGLAHPIALPADTGPTWKPVVVRRPAGPFTLRVTDESPTASLAFTLPKEIGGMTLLSDFLLARAIWIALLGIILVVAGTWPRSMMVNHPKQV